MSQPNPIEFTEKDVYQLISEAGLDPVDAQKVKRQYDQLREEKRKKDNGTSPKDPTRKDTVPVRPLYGGRIYENGPFPLLENEVWSTAIQGGSALMSWIPTQTMTARKKTVSHIEWVAPKGYTGAETYPEWLSSIVIGECGYGPATSWSGFSYEVGAGSFSFTTDSMKPYEDGGIRYYEDIPTISVRGDNVGMNVITKDSEWGIARMMMVMESHLDYIIKHGDRSNSPMEWDGIDQIVRPGYVASRVIGSGVPTWADPIWINGAGFSTVAEVANSLRIMVRLLRRRASARRWGLRADDMIITMSSVMWDNLSEYLAMGAMYRYESTFGFTGDMSFRDFKAEYREVLARGVDVDGQWVPVIPDDSFGAGTQFDTGGGAVDAITSDIYILTRRAGPHTFWTQEYLDWNSQDYATSTSESRFNINGGNVRAGWVVEANKCYYYYGEMVGRLVCAMLPMQGRISNVTIPILSDLENETAYFYNADFATFKALGGQGGMGTDYLDPV